VATTATRNGRRTNRSVADGVNTIKIGDNNVEYAYWPARARVEAGTRATFIKVGDIPHTATATKTAE
jgi:plastocyanin